MRSFRVLSCLRQGRWGVDAINQEISKRVRAFFRGGDFWIVPLLITENDRELGLFNGDTGLLVKRSGFSHLERTDEAVFESEDGYRVIPAVLLPPFEYGYCLSVHKSQGSEYEEVALVVPPGSEQFGREILYTGVTRARRHVEIIGDVEVIKAAVLQSSQKASRLEKRLGML